MGTIIAGASRVIAPVATIACALVVLALAGLLAARPLDVQALVDRSDSMRPAIAAGDLVLSRLGSPRKLAVGDIATFVDPERSGRLITHRVVERRLTPEGEWAFVTRGDANSGVERWKVGPGASVGRYIGRIPRAGYAVAWASSPVPRTLLLGVGGLALGLLVLRRIWT